MVKVNEKLHSRPSYKIMFNERENHFPRQLMKDIRGRLESFYSESRGYSKHNGKNQWAFYLVQNYDKKTKLFLERELLLNQHTYALVVVNTRVTKDMLDYLSLPVQGIVSLSFLSSRSGLVIDSLTQNGIFLEPELHWELSFKLAEKKSFHTPIKQFILNKEKITADLSQRDQQVLQLLLEGYNNAQIADKMHFARSTISTIISSLLKKMKANDRTDCTVKAIRNGWVDCQR
ncbi:response regulator transcription factor [Salipaludibacillus aurantiacus]|uniref:Regulatory protein, luxR family n=1 Tax=Salipaludibacillus aurantiacus TaxID=1601833 RepID=A0A1H9XA29_9BACI|nr:LuxR C-terminal-related transcriptional regulator [Salipaludibacillus aurantiacus]SES43030.1 regulatory protein, luxR family [Salipaludibacillus aurantiacus]